MFQVDLASELLTRTEVMQLTGRTSDFVGGRKGSRGRKPSGFPKPVLHKSCGSFWLRSQLEGWQSASESRSVGPTDLPEIVDAAETAPLLGLSHRNSVAKYRKDYPDFPLPILEPPRGKGTLWLKADIIRWATLHPRFQ